MFTAIDEQVDLGGRSRRHGVYDRRLTGRVYRIAAQDSTSNLRSSFSFHHSRSTLQCSYDLTTLCKTLFSPPVHYVAHLLCPLNLAEHLVKLQMKKTSKSSVLAERYHVRNVDGTQTKLSIFSLKLMKYAL